MTVHSRKAKLLFLMSAAVLALAPVLTGQTISVLASGFNNPRGLNFGPDGNLYVAEGGSRRYGVQCRTMPTSADSGRTLHRRIHCPNF